MRNLARWIDSNLPIYIHLSNMKRHYSPANKGLTLAIWNCGDCTKKKRYGESYPIFGLPYGKMDFITKR